MMNAREKVEPAVKRLRIAGKFADGMQLSKDACCDMANALEKLADYADATEALEYHRALMWKSAREVAMWVLVIAVLVAVYNVGQ